MARKEPASLKVIYYSTVLRCDVCLSTVVNIMVKSQFILVHIRARESIHIHLYIL